MINSLCGGGAERVMTTLLRHSDAYRDDFDIHLGLLDREPTAYPVPEWISIHQLDCRFGLIASVRQLRALATSLQPHVMASFLTRANVANCLVSSMRKTPAIISERINTDMQLGRGLRGFISRRIVRFAYPKASRVIAVSLGVGTVLARDYGVAQSRIDVIANPIDIAQISSRAKDRSSPGPRGRYVVAMGRLVPQKNYPLLLRAFAMSGLAGSLVIAGEGPERDKLLQIAHELGIADRLHLPGFLANPYPLLSRAQCFVLSSIGEGFPNALVEAMSLGIPCIATNCRDGPAEILARLTSEQVTGPLQAPCGLLVPVNDPGAMSQALRQIRDPALCRRLTGAARARAQELTVERSVSNYWRIIEAVLDGHSARL